MLKTRFANKSNGATPDAARAIDERQLQKRLEELREQMNGVNAQLAELTNDDAHLVERLRLVQVRIQLQADAAEAKDELIRSRMETELPAFRAIQEQLRSVQPALEAAALEVARVWEAYEAIWAEYVAWNARMRDLFGNDRNEAAPTLTASLATNLPPTILQPMRFLAERAPKIEELRARDELLGDSLGRHGIAERNPEDEERQRRAFDAMDRAQHGYRFEKIEFPAEPEPTIHHIVGKY